MWFKNLRIYRLTRPFELSPEAVSARLDQQAFQPCARLASASHGWVSPLGRLGEQKVHVVNGCIMICARRDEKILPPGVIRAMVTEKVDEIEDTQLRKVNRRERNDMRDDLYQELLPRALCRSARTYAYIIPQDDLLIIDSASASRAEELISLLRESLDGLSAVPLALKASLPMVMTRWLSEVRLPAGLTLGSQCVLRDPSDQDAVVRCRHIDITGDEVQTHLDAGRQLVQLELEWNETFSFLFNEDFTLRRIRFTDIVQEQAGEIDDEDDGRVRFDNDFAIMTLAFARCLPHLIEACGGEDRAAYPPQEQAA